MRDGVDYVDNDHVDDCVLRVGVPAVLVSLSVSQLRAAGEFTTCSAPLRTPGPGLVHYNTQHSAVVSILVTLRYCDTR